MLAVRGPQAFGPAGFGFYQISFATGQPAHDQAQQQASRLLLLAFMREVTARYDVPAGQVYLLGFSQGAVMAYDVALRHPAQVRGVLAFSGRLLPASRQHHAPAADIQAVRFFLSHGRRDELLPAFHVAETLAFFRNLGITPHYAAFAGGHEVPASSVAAARTWLAGQV